MALFVRRPRTHVPRAPSYFPPACLGSAVRFPISASASAQQPGRPDSEAKGIASIRGLTLPAAIR
jgi:hypothetical protein